VTLDRWTPLLQPAWRWTPPVSGKIRAAMPATVFLPGNETRSPPWPTVPREKWQNTLVNARDF
jgi:hypothetical protein